MANGRLERREEAIDLALGHLLTLVKAGKRQAWGCPKVAIDVTLGCLRTPGRLDRPEEAMDLQTLPVMPRSDAVNLGLAWRCASLRL